MRTDIMVKSKLSAKRKKGISIPLAIAMIVFLVAATSASISAFEWLRDVCLSRAYIKGVTVKGNQRISSENIMDASHLRVGIDSIRSIMPHIVEKYIRTQSRYVEQVSVKRRFVRESRAGLGIWMTIEVAEREPIALIDFQKNAGSSMVLDARGFVLEEVPAGTRPACLSPHENLPVIVGVDEEILSSETQNKLDMGGILDGPILSRALNVLTTARSVIPELFSEISCVDARDPDNIILLLWEKGKAKGGEQGAKGTKPEVTVRLASDQIREGLSNILPVIMKRRAENKRTKYVDARFSGAVYCGEEIDYEGGWKSG